MSDKTDMPPYATLTSVDDHGGCFEWDKPLGWEGIKYTIAVLLCGMVVGFFIGSA